MGEMIKCKGELSHFLNVLYFACGKGCMGVAICQNALSCRLKMETSYINHTKKDFLCICTESALKETINGLTVWSHHSDGCQFSETPFFDMDWVSFQYHLKRYFISKKFFFFVYRIVSG